MLITMHRSGGFAAIPALSRKLSVDTASLPRSEAEQIESAVRAARIPELAQPSESAHLSESAQPSGGSPKSGDRFLYHLTVNDGTTSHTVTVTEPFPDPALGTLIDLLSSYQ